MHPRSQPQYLDVTGPRGLSYVDQGRTNHPAAASVSHQHRPANIGALLLLRGVAFRRILGLKCPTHMVGQNIDCDYQAVD